jgi:hypothetical protein
MMLIPLGSRRPQAVHTGYWATVDEDDEDLARMAWYARTDLTSKHKLIYAVHTTSSKLLKFRTSMHRLIWQRAYGPIPDGYRVDHIQHGEFGGLDNRRSNLRLATPRGNSANGRMRANNTSGYRGIHWVARASKWHATIRNIAGKKVHLGYFVTPEEAARAYDAAALEVYGEFASLNFRGEK